MAQKKTRGAVPHRNPLVAAVMKKAVRRHGRSIKAARAADKVALRRETARAWD